MKISGIILAFILMATTTNAQMLIKGVVFDQSTNEPLPGATIQVKETEKGTIADENGRFSIQLSEGSYTLIFTFVGYQSSEVVVNESTELNIGMTSDIKLEEVIIRAIRGDENVPVSKHNISKKEIESEYSGQDPLFLMNKKSPSLISYSESGTNFTNYGQMRLRGIGQSRINITLDGAPLNDMIDHGVFFSNFTDFANSVESIQIQRGVGTSTNGIASYAGSINFESIDLKNTAREAQLQFSAGSFNSLRASAELKTGMLDNNTSFYTRFSKINSDGYRYNTSSDAYSFFFSGAYFGEKDIIKLTGFTGQSKNGLAYSPVALSDIENDPRTNYVNENDIDDFGQDFVQLQYTRSFSIRSSWVSSIYYGAAGGDFPAGFNVTDSIYSSDEPDNYFLQERFMQINFPLFNDHIGFTSYFNHLSTDRNLNFNAGLHVYNFRRKNLENIVPNQADPYYDERSWKNEISLFAKADYHLNRVMLLGDIQFRTMALTINPDDQLLPAEPNIRKNWTFINPKIGLTYTLDNTKSLYAFYGFSGREPTKIDILGGFQLNPSNLPSVKSDDVKPEYVHDIEGGFRFTNENWDANVNAFYMKFENEIAPIGEYVPEGFIQLRKNIPSSFRTGIEFDWSWAITQAFTFTGNSTYMKSRIDVYDPDEDPDLYTDVSQPLSPEFMGTASLSYEISRFFNVELSGRYMSESYLEPTNQENLVMPSFFIMNARLGINFMESNSLNIFVNNIFDKQYFTYGAPVDPDFDGVNEPGYFVQPPRNLFATLIVRF